MADSTIAIKLIDGGRGASPGVPTGNSGAGSPLIPQLVQYQPGMQPPGAALTPSGSPRGAPIAGKSPGGAASAEATAAMSGLAKAAGVAGLALVVFGRYVDMYAAALNIGAMRIAKTTEAATARIRNDEESALAAERERRAKTWTGALDMVGMIPGLSLITNPIKNAVEAQKNKDIAEMQAFSHRRDALRDRGRELSRYDGRLAQTFAMGDVQRQRRDIGEANIIGGAMSEVEARQQQLDRLNQQLGVLNKIKEAGDQSNRLNDEIAKRQAALEEALKGLPAEMAKKIRELGDAVKDPFQLLEERGGFATGIGAFDQSATDRSLAERQRIAKLNVPMMAGLG